MTQQEQAYINGFVKRASEYGFAKDEAVELFKSAGNYTSSYFSPYRHLDTSILRQNRPAMVNPQSFDRDINLDKNVRDAYRQSNPYEAVSKTTLFPESLNKLMNRSQPEGVNKSSFTSPISLSPTRAQIDERFVPKLEAPTSLGKNIFSYSR
jgi:hypothetical protein